MCDDAEFLAFEVNHRVDSRVLHKEYFDRLDVKYRKIYNTDGGTEIAWSTGNGTGSSNPKWIIRPDKSCNLLNHDTWRQLLDNEGITPHVCAGGISLYAPYDGQLLVGGYTYQIKWHSKKVTGNVKIELFKGGSLKEEIASSASNNGSYDWEIAADFTPGDDYRIKVTSIQNSSFVGQNDANFTIFEKKSNTLPYEQNFDTWGIVDKMDSWTQATDDNNDWAVNWGPTMSQVDPGGDKTGAKSDHTSGDGQYILVESAWRVNQDKTASILTPVFDFSTLPNPTMTFYYHMLSSANEMGTFYVDVKLGNNSWNEGIVEITGNQGKEWKLYTLDLTSITNNNSSVQFRLRAHGRPDGEWSSDICIDDFKIADDQVSISNIVKKGHEFHFGYENSVLHYSIPESKELAHVNIKLFNTQGKEIKTLVNNTQKNGEYTVKLKDLAKGMYLCKIEIADFQKAIKIFNK